LTSLSIVGESARLHLCAVVGPLLICIQCPEKPTVQIHVKLYPRYEDRLVSDFLSKVNGNRGARNLLFLRDFCALLVFRFFSAIF